MSDNLIYDSVQSSENDKKAFVVIHGWKGNKDSFKTIASLLKLDSITWFFPEAPFLVEGDENKKTWSYQREDGSWEVEKPKNMLNDFLVNHVFYYIMIISFHFMSRRYFKYVIVNFI